MKDRLIAVVEHDRIGVGVLGFQLARDRNHGDTDIGRVLVVAYLSANSAISIAAMARGSQLPEWS
jgi:hypothetical protein